MARLAVIEKKKIKQRNHIPSITARSYIHFLHTTMKLALALVPCHIMVKGNEIRVWKIEGQRGPGGDI